MVLKEKGAYMKRNGLLLLLMVVFLQGGCGKAEEESIAETELPWYGLYNINTGEGFSSFEYED